MAPKVDAVTLRMFVLVSAAAVLVTSAIPSPAPRNFDGNLNAIFDLAAKVNQTFVTKVFVEDVSHLTEGNDKCQTKFFCKVYNILQKHFVHGKERTALVRNLKVFLHGRSPNCTELLRDIKPTGVRKPVQSLMRYLTHCIHHRNYIRADSNPRGTHNSYPTVDTPL